MCFRDMDVECSTAVMNTSCGNEVLYMRGACGVSRWDGESSEDMYRRFGMSAAAVGMDCRAHLRWYGHVMSMNERDFTKMVYESRIEGRGVRGRPPVKWINRVEEYWRESERMRFGVC